MAILVTASVMAGDRERITSSEFDGCIVKPIDPETFIGGLRRHLAPSGHEETTAGER